LGISENGCHHCRIKLVNDLWRWDFFERITRDAQIEEVVENKGYAGNKTRGELESTQGLRNVCYRTARRAAPQREGQTGRGATEPCGTTVGRAQRGVDATLPTHNVKPDGQRLLRRGFHETNEN